MKSMAAFRRALLDWFGRHRRELPWRATTDPYRIWLSEIMLQQTQVAVVAPYYERFLKRFPSLESLAAASEDEVLSLWAGLGYYARARNLHRAARLIAQSGRFPDTLEEIRALPGVGDYAAAAIASIAFNRPHAAVDGNVLRVLARLDNDFADITAARTKNRLRARAEQLLDRRDPGTFNQALMELGATICLPRNPRCSACPIERFCQARQMATQHELPVRRARRQTVHLERALLVIRKPEGFLMRRRRGEFWEFPEAGQVAAARILAEYGCFRHTITHRRYRFTVYGATVKGTPPGFEWVDPRRGGRPGLSTTARKALHLFRQFEPQIKSS